MSRIAKLASTGWKLLTRLLDGLPDGLLVEPKNRIITTSYLSSIFYPETFQKAVPVCIDKAKELQKELKFDSIAFSGTSGSAMGFILGHALNIPVICVRKQKDNSHFAMSDRVVEGNIGTNQYLIVDDLISSGKTVNYIMDNIKQEAPSSRCVGIMLYGSGSDEYEYERPGVTDTWHVYSSRYARSKNGQYEAFY